MKGLRLAALLVALLAAAGASALEFRSVGSSPAVLYDGPSKQANRVLVVSPGSPVEVLSSLEGWHKVRTHSGQLAWVETVALSDRRTTVAVSDLVLRVAPDDASPGAVQVRQGVILELLEVTGPWVKLRHRDGAIGYVRSSQVWGE